MTIPPIPLLPMLWLARANGWAAGSYDIARQENGWRLYGPIKDHPYGLIRASAESKDHPTLAAAQAAAEADRAARIAAELDPARLVQWAAGVPEIAALIEAVGRFHRLMQTQMRTADYHAEGCKCIRCAEDAMFAALRALAGEAGQ
jgi:hypothetical protein